MLVPVISNVIIIKLLIQGYRNEDFGGSFTDNLTVVAGVTYSRPLRLTADEQNNKAKVLVALIKKTSVNFCEALLIFGRFFEYRIVIASIVWWLPCIFCKVLC